jgi:hypothetical protein
MTGDRKARGAGLILLLLLFGGFGLPHGEAAAVGQSGLHAEARQNPAVENVPPGQDAEQDEEFLHEVTSHIFLI